MTKAHSYVIDCVHRLGLDCQLHLLESLDATRNYNLQFAIAHMQHVHRQAFTTVAWYRI
jgi:hypothetical protein